MIHPKKSLPYWKEIFELIDAKTLRFNNELSLEKLLQSGVNNYKQVIEEVTKKSEKFLAAENKIKEIDENLKNQINFELMNYKKTGTYVIT